METTDEFLARGGKITKAEPGESGIAEPKTRKRTIAPTEPPNPKRLLRMAQIIGDEKRGIPPLIPVGRTTINDWVKKGVFPKPIKVQEAIFWRYRDIEEWLDNDGNWPVS